MAAASSSSGSVKQSSLSRDISNNLPGVNPTGGGSQRYDRVSSQNTSPISSGAIPRQPPISSSSAAQRTRDNYATDKADTSFSSAGSAEGAGASAGAGALSARPGSIIESAAGEAMAQDGTNMTQAAATKMTPVSTAIVNTSPATAAAAATATTAATGTATAT
ncbi:hypothetical protein BGZ65_012843, partial [Modicella reniformis]